MVLSRFGSIYLRLTYRNCLGTCFLSFHVLAKFLRAVPAALFHCFAAIFDMPQCRFQALFPVLRNMKRGDLAL